MNIFSKLALCFLITTQLPSCLRTELSSTTLSPKVFQLAAANRNPIHIEVALTDPEQTLGNQYLLIGIPFGSIASNNVSVLVQRALYRKLALKGFTPLVGQLGTESFGTDAPSLSVQIVSPQASAFDLLVTRHLSCSLDLKAQFSKRDMTREANGRGTFEHFGAFAFEREMSLCFTQALDVALDRLLNDLRI